jgi:hypothetical protein
MDSEFKFFGIKVLCVLLVSPIMGWILMTSVESFEKSWKTNNRKKKWIASIGMFLLLAVIAGWLR